MKSEYKQIAEYYDRFVGNKNYKTDFEKIRTLLKKYKTSRGREMLDAACGTGNHIQYFKKYFNITGLDRDTYMLRIARSKHPDIKFIHDDMRTFRLNKKFDVIICLFSAIGHLITYENLNKAIVNFSSHLKEGGVMFMESFLNEKDFIKGYMDAAFVNEPELKLVRMAVSRRIRNVVVVDFHFLAGEEGKIKYFTKKMKIAMFSSQCVLELMKNAGLSAKCVENGLMKSRDLYIGIKH